MDPNRPPISLEGFLRELGLAWQRLSLYQEGHPARREVVTRAHAVLAALTAARGDLSVGVASDGFVARDRKVSGGPLRGLAESLYRRHVALVRFAEETAVEDLRAFLEAVPRSRPAEDETPPWELLAARGVSAVRLEAVDLRYEESGAEEAAGGAANRGEPLWDSLLRAVLGELDRDGEAGERPEPATGRSIESVLELVERVLARRGLSWDDFRGAGPPGALGPGAAPPPDPRSAGAPGPGGRSAAPGDVVAALGASLGATAASRLAAGGGSTGHQVAELLRALPEALSEVVLDRALTELVSPAGAAGEAGAAGFSTLADSLPAFQVIAALRRLRTAGVSFSPSAGALIDGLVAHAGRTGPVSPGPDRLAGELAAVFGDDDPDRRLPREEELDRLALELAGAGSSGLPEPDPGAVSLRVETLTEASQLVQLSLTLLDLLERPFLKRPAQEAVVLRLGEVFRSLLAEGRLAQAMRIPERLQELRAADAGAGAVELALAELRKPASAVAFLERPDELPASAAANALRLTELLGEAVLDGLLEALCEEEDLSRRRQLFDLMVSLGPPIVPRARAFLEDRRWYVQRNMLSLLRRIGGDLPAEVLRRALDREDPRVRLEAVRALGPGRAPAELVERAVNDPDPKVAQAAVAAVGGHRLEAGLAPLLALLEPLDPFGRNRSLRLLALEALGQLGDPSALDGIAHFLRPWYSPVSTEERRAAYASLAGYPPASRRPWLEKGRWSADPVVRRTCKEIRLGADPTNGAAP